MFKFIVGFLFFLAVTNVTAGTTNSHSVLHLDEDNLVTIRSRIDGTTVKSFIMDASKITDNTVYIYINSPGGSVHSGNEIIQTINALDAVGKDVHCIVDFGASMAFAIFQACPHRHVMPHSILMQHQMSLSVEGKYEEIKNYLTMIDDMKQQADDVQSRRLGMSEQGFNSIISNDMWLYGEKILQYAGADEMNYVICDSDLVANTITQQFDTFFGAVDVVFSKCPLIKRPLSIEFVDHHEPPTEEMLSYVNSHYLTNELVENIIH